MIDFRRSDYCSLPKSEEHNYVMKSILMDGYVLQDYVNYIDSVDCFEIYVNGSYCGFYTAEDLGNLVEVHLYINKSKRKYSFDIMREVKSIQTKPIITTVSSDYAYVVKCLERIGFKITHIDYDSISKDGNVLNLIYLEFKEF